MNRVAKNKAQFLADAEKMYDGLASWRGTQATASYDELAGQVTVRRQALMGELLGMLATQEGQGEFLAEGKCPACGGQVHYKGKKRKRVLHAEGEATIARGYHHCDECGHGFFPSGPDVAVR